MSTELELTQDKLDLIRRTVMPQGATNDELQLFLHQVKRTGLDPLARQIYATKVGGRVAISPTIDGFRLIADRTGKYSGQLGPQWCGEDGVWKDVWIGKNPPAAARVGVIRTDFKEPLWGVATWSTYAKQVNGKLQFNWSAMPDLMLAKCAEAQALRKAFPQELSGLYEPAELEQAETQTRKEKKGVKEDQDTIQNGSKEAEYAHMTATHLINGTAKDAFWLRIKQQFEELSERLKTCPDSVKDKARKPYAQALKLIDKGADQVKVTQLYSQIEQAIENDSLATQVVNLELQISAVMETKGLKAEDWQAELDPFTAACKAGDYPKAISFGLAALSVLEGI